MTVQELTKRCYDTIIIYTNTGKDYTEYEDLFKGTKENIPKDLLEKEIRCFGAKQKNVIEIKI